LCIRRLLCTTPEGKLMQENGGWVVFEYCEGGCERLSGYLF
jgi:hypothetical protein